MRARELSNPLASSLFDALWEQRRWLMAVFVAHFLDILTTAVGFRLGIREGNPFEASLLASHGELGMFAVKVLLVVGMVLAFQVLRLRYRHLWLFFLLLTVPTFLVVANNLLSIAQSLT